MILLREELGEVLRDARTAQRRTLREVSRGASVSLGYLSEIERGEKEASSELLSSVCAALGLQLSEVLEEVRARVARTEDRLAPVVLPVGDQRTPGASASAA